MQRRKKRKQDDINTNGWMDTYSDTITLLLTFFILLYSFAETDNEKFMKVAAAFQGEIVGQSITAEQKEKLEGLPIPKLEKKNAYENLVDKVNGLLKENNLDDIVKIREEETGVVLQLSENILFDPAKAELKSNSKKILDVISQIIPQVDNEIMVQGHTDNIPIKTYKYESNWELSTARSTEVLKYFIHEKGFNPQRFSATGYGEYRPLVENSTEENRATNRRVDILIVQKKEK